jgi:hypothetical protein
MESASVLDAVRLFSRIWDPRTIKVFSIGFNAAVAMGGVAATF